MYAIVDFKGTQFKVEKSQTLKVPFLSDLKEGDKVAIDNVLLIKDGENITVGSPTIESAKVTAEVIGHGKDKKVIIFKKKRRKGYEKKQGHRQNFTEVKITDINN